MSEGKEVKITGCHQLLDITLVCGLSYLLLGQQGSFSLFCGINDERKHTAS